MKWIRSKKAPTAPKTVQPQKQYAALYACLTVGLMVTGYLVSPYGKVGDMFVAGDTVIPDQLVLEASRVTRKQTLVGTLASEKTIEMVIIDELPQVKGVQVKRQGINDVIFEIEEYKTIAYLNNANLYQRILENGVILNETSSFPMGNEPLFTKFEQGPILNEFIDSFTTISKDVKDSISEIQYQGTKTNPFKISIYMNDGNQIIANTTDFAKKIAYYPDILQKLEGQKGTVDMEVGVFFTPFDKTTEQEVSVDVDSED